MKQAILSTAYLGPVSYYAVLSQSDNVLIEQYDSYHKQTYRNRCRVLAANGPIDLTIPVVKLSHQKMLVKDVRIDYSTLWQNNHWRTLVSAYNSSPFFEYYSPMLEPFYTKKHEFLLDFNMQLNELLVELLQIDKNIQLTGSFEKNHVQRADFRDVISPKHSLQIEGNEFTLTPYTQTFCGKFDFIPDLSVVDLLFNCGPDSESILLSSRFPDHLGV